MIPTSIIDNFFECPTFIRNYALSLNYSKVEGNYPGIRSECLSLLNPELFNYISNRIMSIFYDYNMPIKWNMNIRFQLASERYESGWVHYDHDNHIAGVIYLNPEAPLNSGTLICKPNTKFNDDLDYSIRDEFYHDKKVDMELYRTERENHNNKFDVTLQVNNIYNRATIYNAFDYHRENIFFGDTKESSRLTLIFFANITDTVDKTLLQKSKLNYNY